MGLTKSVRSMGSGNWGTREPHRLWQL